ncbi:fatty acid desaturase [Reyranella sp. CPCC 100927]|uniref:acyl-CoA desaturase n=1 Tax=Reyranella sp. CPCC 100927 TaxID=2599616 RepID=UPI0011B5F45C|nr:fatty acid desaturase [Reyranella sp. CPCC 100927]TWT05155.1 acyl-CoA desaturase [Reyranella sp. CPCC 100927]
MLGLHRVVAGGGRSDLGRRLDIPQTARPLHLIWSYATAIAAIHAFALLAFVPWFFSWTGVVLAVLGLYVFGTLGINLCYHRLLTHRGVVCPAWLEHALAILGVCCVQDTPARWIAIHRRHHAQADEQPDPHSPRAGFLWAHLGWIVVRNQDLVRPGLVSRYAKDILRDPFYARLEPYPCWVGVILLSWLLFFVGGFVAEWMLGGSVDQALQFGLSLLVWGVFVRTVLVWHITWSVNSVAHLWGYRTYETGESSRNNLLVGFISNGEGWHNNHHADPRSARHGHQWWELDVTWLTIRLLAAVGLAGRIATPSVQRQPGQQGALEPPPAKD